MLCRILLVDDDPAMLNALRAELLRKPDLGDEGIEIESFASAAEALERVALPDGDFHAAIVDYRMPGLDGVSLLERMRALRPDMVRILLTGTIDMKGAVAAINAARVDQIVAKPWQEYDLKARAALAMRQHALLARARKRAGAPAAPADASPYLVLLVDDEPRQLDALEREISLYGRATAGPHALFEIVKATAPEAALVAAAQRCPDIVIADYRMPSMDGVTLLSKIRAPCPASVFILMSGYATPEMLVEAINRAGVHHFVAKPWDADALRGVVAEAIRHRDLLRAAG